MAYEDIKKRDNLCYSIYCEDEFNDDIPYIDSIYPSFERWSGADKNVDAWYFGASNSSGWDKSTYFRYVKDLR